MSTNAAIKAAPQARQIVDVLVPVALDQAYSYRVPAGMELTPGDVVTVPLGARDECTGVVWGEGIARPGLDNRLKDVDASSTFRRSRRSCASSSTGSRTTRWRARGMVLRMALRMGELGAGARARRRAQGGPPPAAHDDGARARVVALFADGMVRAKGEAAQEAGVSAGVIDGLVDEARWRRWCCRRSRWRSRPIRISSMPDFSPAQQSRGG